MTPTSTKIGIKLLLESFIRFIFLRLHALLLSFVSFEKNYTVESTSNILSITKQSKALLYIDNPYFHDHQSQKNGSQYEEKFFKKC